MNARAQRLAEEDQMLRFIFREKMRIQDVSPPGPNPAVVGQLRSNAGKLYTIFVPLPTWPFAPPPLYVVDPVLTQRDRSPLAQIGTSSQMHVLAPDMGRVRLCHYNDTFWRMDIPLFKVVMKARLWLEAYEAYLETGHAIDHYLGHM